MIRSLSSLLTSLSTTLLAASNATSITSLVSSSFIFLRSFSMSSFAFSLIKSTSFLVSSTILSFSFNAVTLAVLLNEVWGYNSDDDVRMLRVHVGGLRQKIEQNPKIPEYLHTVTNVGYKLTPFGEEID